MIESGISCFYLNTHFLQKPACNSHRAVLDGEKSGPGKRVRGLGAIACARHGCFAPSSVVDFPKGEKQMHMDWALFQAILSTHMTDIEIMALIYDIVCEYGVRLALRFLEHSGLSFPEGLEVVKAIGLFHVHGHQAKCLHRYATTYVPNLAIIDGEILETLWSVINQTARSTRGATTAHRREILDDHMGDSNWKKTIRMGSFYIFRYMPRQIT